MLISPLTVRMCKDTRFKGAYPHRLCQRITPQSEKLSIECGVPCISSTRENSQTICINNRAKLKTVGYVIWLVGVVVPIYTNIVHHIDANDQSNLS